MGWHQQAGFPILSVITYLPLAGVVLIALFGKGRPLFFKVVSLVVTLAAFGLSIVEAMASGKPVVALGRGGVLEAVPPSGGVFYNDPGDAALEEALRRFEEVEPLIQPSELQAWAGRFSEARFRERMLDLIGGTARAREAETLVPLAPREVRG